MGGTIGGRGLGRLTSAATADDVTVAEEDGCILGFVACQIQTDTAVHLQRRAGTIVLIGTAAAARGRHVGSALLQTVLNRFAGRDAVAVEVGTQLRNVVAARLYERRGFRLVAGALSFRFMVER